MQASAAGVRSPAMAKRFLVDPTSSTLRVRTRATGLLARLAHDLELVAREMRGEADDQDGAWTAELVVPVEALRVAGTLRGDRLDLDGLSPADREEIQRKLRSEVLGPGEVHATASGPSRDRGEARITVSGKRGQARVALRVKDEDGALRVAGESEVSLSQLGVAEIKGPLGAFKVKDKVSVLFDLVLRPSDETAAG